VIPQQVASPPSQLTTAAHFISPTTTPGAASQYKIKRFIDDIYQKEMKYRYHKQYVREDYLCKASPIFDL